MRATLLPLLVISLVWSAEALAQNATTPGTPSSPWPTLHNLSIEWPISGDADEDGVVTVRFREQGATAWRSAMPLRRVAAGSIEGYTWGNRHVGSVFDLDEGTTYELELTLVDPDGGGTVRTLAATTRVEPQAAANGTVRPVTPATISAALSTLAPGDILVLADGTYPALTVPTSGTAAMPIVLRSANHLKAVVNGELILSNREHVIAEGLRVNGRVRLYDSRFVTVRRNHVVVAGSDGIRGNYAQKANIIVDNIVEGDTQWVEASLGYQGNNAGEGIAVTGPGHVICWNRVTGFRDGISTLEGTLQNDQQSIDICENDVNIGADDGIEADFTIGNVRVVRNRIRNSFMGISGQPTLGGPLYAIRNEMQNVVRNPFKLLRASTGNVGLHNTVIKPGDAFPIYTSVPFSQSWFRNNIFIGGGGGGTYNGYDIGSGRVAFLDKASPSCTFDYDGFGSIGTGTFNGKIHSASFTSYAQMKSTTTEMNAVQVDLSVFQTQPAFPSNGPFPERAPMDLRLAATGAAVDVGLVLPNVNDGFSGAGPDLGAIEAGRAPPVYGPRAFCGDGVVHPAEGCDDFNTTPGDGCSASCQLEGADGGDASDAGSAADAGEPPDAGAFDGGSETGADAGAGADAGEARELVDGGPNPGDEEVTGVTGCGCGSAPAGSALAWLASLMLAWHASVQRRGRGRDPAAQGR